MKGSCFFQEVQVALLISLCLPKEQKSGENGQKGPSNKGCCSIPLAGQGWTATDRGLLCPGGMQRLSEVSSSHSSRPPNQSVLKILIALKNRIALPSK